MAEVPIAVFLLENSTNITTSLPSHSATGRESTEGGGTQNLWGPKRDPLWVVVPVTVYYVIIFISGVVGNVSTCVVIARSKHMHTATNYYLFSLAISDLLLLLSGLPPEMYHIWSNYPYVFGETFCVLTGFASETSTNATVLTITAFTVERYVAICHPFLSHTVSKLSRAVKFIMAIWIFSMILAVPQAIQMGLVYLRDEDGHIVSEEYTSCTIKHSIIPYSFFISTVLFFLTPMTLITVLYVLIGVRLHSSNQITHDSSQRRRRTLVVDKETHVIVRGSQRNGQHSKSTKRVVKMLVAVVVAFFICWAPFQVQRLYAIYGFAGEDTTATEILVYKIMSVAIMICLFTVAVVVAFFICWAPFQVQRLYAIYGFAGEDTTATEILVYKIMTYASGLLYYLSTTINPILYNIMSLKFRQAFKSSLTKCLGRDRLRRSGELASSGGGGGGSLGAGRFHFGRCSSRNHNNNNSLSSGNSSYVDPGTDLSKRPLVVSFRRRSVRTSTSSLPPTTQPAPPYLLNVPELSVSSGDDSQCPVPCPRLTSTPVPRNPRIEDIEIFQECQLKIQRSVKRHKDSSKSCSVIRPEKSKFHPVDQDPLRYVHKSFTVPCLVLH